MHELQPGLFRWTAFHEGIGMEVSSLFVAGETAALVDPMLPEGGVEAVARLGTPEAIVLTNRHHLRHAERFVKAFECPILCHEAGLHEFADGGPTVTPFRFGDTLRPGVEALKRDIRAAVGRLLELDREFDTLVFAHGDPVDTGGREALERFLAA